MKSTDVESYLDRLAASDVFAPHFRTYGVRYRWYVLSTITLASITVMLSSTIINIAIPNIMGAFGIGQERAQLLATMSYAVGTVSMLCGDWLVMVIGIRWTVALAVGLFMLGSFVAGIANSFEVLMAARIVQSVPQGIILPLSVTVIFQLFPTGQQGVPIGISTAAAMIGPTFAPTIGGLIIDALNWRYCFLMGIPLAVVALLAAIAILPKRGDETPPRMDWVGLSLVTAAVMLLLMALTDGERDGWNSNITIARFGLVALLITGLAVWSRRQRDPIIDFGLLFSQRRFATFCLVGFAFGGGMFASIYLLPLFLRLAQHLTPTDTGLLLMPGGFAMALSFPLGGRLSEKVDLRALITVGSLVSAVSFWLLTSVDGNTGFLTIIYISCLTRIGTGIVMPALQIGAIGGLPPAQIGKANGTFAFFRHLGGSFGVNLSSLALEHRTSLHRDAYINTQNYANADSMNVFDHLQGLAAHLGLSRPDSWQAALTYMQQIINAESLVRGFQDTHLLLGLAFLVIVPTVWTLKRVATAD